MDKWGSPARESTANFWIKKKTIILLTTTKYYRLLNCIIS